MVATLLAVATLGLQHPPVFQQLCGSLSWRLSKLNSSQLSDVVLALATLGEFPISVLCDVESSIKKRFKENQNAFPLDDMLSLTWSLAAVGCFVDTFPILLLKILQHPELKNFTKLQEQQLYQVVNSYKKSPECSRFFEEKNFEKFKSDEILELLKSFKVPQGEEVKKVSESLTQLSMMLEEAGVQNFINKRSDDNFYNFPIFIDKKIQEKNTIILLDDSGFADFGEPLDPFLRLKQTQLQEMGFRAVWLHEVSWIMMSVDDKMAFVREIISPGTIVAEDEEE